MSSGSHVGGTLHRTPANRPTQGRGTTPAFGGPGIPVPAPPVPSEAGSGVSDVRKRQSKKDEVCPNLPTWLFFIYISSPGGCFLVFSLKTGACL